MPSQEDLLDNILNELQEQETDGAADEPKYDENARLDSAVEVNDTQDMTADDIEKLLSESQQFGERAVGSDQNTDKSDMDLMDLLKPEEDSDLQEIHDLLQKAENNEAVDDDITALLQDQSDEMDIPIENADEVSEDADTASVSMKEKRKKEKEEKKAAKLAKKEAEKKEKTDRKANKKAEKKSGKRNSENAEQNLEEIDNPAESEEISEEDLSDMQDLLNLAEREKQQPVEFSAINPEDDIAFLENRTDANKKQGKKKNVFSKIMDFLTEEDEEDEEIRLSDENKDILKELDEEEDNKKGSKKESKNKKEKKPKKDKKPKKEKPKKEKSKKEKESKEGTPEQNIVKIPIKRILPIVFVCLTLVTVIIIVVNVTGDYSSKKLGREAYFNGDYQTCYQNLFGRSLNESEQIMFSKSESILRIRLWIREYEMFVEEGSEAEALDSLIQSVNAYPDLYNYSVQWNAGAEVTESYVQILSILADKYHLTEEQALEIAATKDDVEYSKMVYAIADGKAFGSWNEPIVEEIEIQPEILQDVLPEEEELGNTSFVDNNINE